MAHTIDRDTVQDLLANHRAQLVEVLPLEEYEWAHLPGAAHLPLKGLDEESATWLDASRPVIVYCHDRMCDMSPRAARRLERIGFDRVLDYAEGKMDWISAGLPFEGHAVLVAQAVRRDPVIAYLDDRADEVAERIIDDPAGLAVVVDRDRVVQGVIGPDELKGVPPGATAEHAMRFGVTTVRLSEDMEPLVRRMDRAKIHQMVVTLPDGRLVGLFVLDAVRSPESEPDQG
ncbi:MULTISPECIES: rhodanese-like domain-containing protein [Microtetraspora]|uniref:Rhodanese-like domain-containing protein n=1 Tax=Microtetraspora glauca TaxID=1996 RepID=A0ABV3GIY9_MICGL|nr:rhodanese-like domain-containing protein [Microtetraspora sp. AC03309]MCC5576839.1 rhodanese-like domain-containing protein [Microtetraspora sp. AC03309]